MDHQAYTESVPDSVETSARAETPRKPDILEHLRLLRDHLGTLGPPAGCGSLIASMSEAAERLSVEHTGMAEELLSVYEQLGIVFEVTRKLSGVRSEVEVIDLFVDSLQRSFQKHRVFFTLCNTFAEHERLSCGAATSGGGDSKRERKDQLCAAVCSPEKGVSRNESDPKHEEIISGTWFDALVERARRERSVLVEHPCVDASSGEIAEVMVGPVFADDRGESAAGGSFVGAIVVARGSSVDRYRASDMLLLEALTMFCGDLIRNHRLVRELREMLFAVVRSLVNAVDQKDAYTSGHSVRVAYFATLLGREVGVGGRDLRMLQWSALLHDVGKIGIRDNVLKKEGKLSGEEFDHIKEHPVRSYEVVQEVPQLADALDGVLHHHERFDGKGYPSGLVGEGIPLQARIVQIADVFDALTSTRSYRPAYDWRPALDVLAEEAGKTVDPHLQEVFDRLIRAEVEGNPGGWEEMVRRADRFTESAASRGL